MKGLALSLPYGVCARIGSVAAAYALEHLGGMSHAYTWDEFTQRFESHFGPLPIGLTTLEVITTSSRTLLSARPRVSSDWPA